MSHRGLLLACVLAGSGAACGGPARPVLVPMELPPGPTGTTSAPIPAPPPSVEIRAGDAVEVEWHGDWYPAHVLSVEPGPSYAIRYDGYGTEWDETVEAARVRRPGVRPDEPDDEP